MIILVRSFLIYQTVVKMLHARRERVRLALIRAGGSRSQDAECSVGVLKFDIISKVQSGAVAVSLRRGNASRSAGINAGAVRARRRTAINAAYWLLLALALLSGAIWQWQSRMYQQVDFGAPLDEGFSRDFYGREQSAADPDQTFRWSKPEGEITLWPLPPATSMMVSLHVLAPPQMIAPQQATLCIGAHTLPLTLAPAHRTYRLLVAPAPQVLTSVRMEISPLKPADDLRALGLALDRVAVEPLAPSTLGGLIREAWMAPYLPLGIIFLVIGAGLLRLPLSVVSILALSVVGGLALAGCVVPEARLALAAYLTVFAGAAALLLVGAEAVRRLDLWPADDRRAHRWLIAVFIATFAVAFVPGVGSDGAGYFAYLHSLFFDGDLNFANEYREMPFPHVPRNLDALYQPATGYYSNPFSIGPALLWIPLYSIAHLITLVGQAAGWPWQPDGYDQPYEVLIAFSGALAGLLTLFVLYRIIRRLVDPPIATLAVLTLWLGSNLFYYNLREGSFAHSFSALAVSLFILAWLRLEERPGVWRWAVLGIMAGLSTLIYWISALLLLPAALTFARLLWQALREPAVRRGRELARLAAGAGLAALLVLVMFTPQMLAWRVIFGAYLAIPQGAGFVTPGDSHWLDFLFSTLHGLLPWTPAFFVGGIGVVLLWSRHRWMALCLTVPLLISFWYNTTLLDWHGSGAFGMRRMTVLAPWFAIGLALAFDRLRRWQREAPLILAAFAISWTLLLVVRYDLYLISHNPSDLYDLPALAFYLSRETLPVWLTPDWLRSGFFYRYVTDYSPPARAGLTALIVVMAVLIWAVARLSGRFIVAHSGRIV